MNTLDIYKCFNEINDLNSKESIKENFEKICNEILKYTKSDSVSLFIFDLETYALKPYIVTSKIDKLKVFNEQLKVSKEDLIKILNDKSTYYQLYLKESEILEKYEIKEIPDIQYNHCYKMVIGDEFLGVINICYIKESKNNTTEEMHEFLKFISNMTGIVIKNFRLGEKIEVENHKRVVVENELDNYFDISADLVSIYEINGNISKFSDSWIKLLGWSIEELNSFKMKDIVHKDDSENIKKLNKYLLKSDGCVRNKKAKTTLRHS